MTAADIATALGGRRSGDGWIARCPAHDDHTPSLSVKECDGRTLVHCHAGCEQSAVIAALRERSLWSAARPMRADPRVIVPVPNTAPAAVFKHRGHGTASQHWTYRDAEGRVLGYVARFETATGKQVLPLTYCQEPKGQRRWRWRSWPEPRPLYGLDRLSTQAGALAIIVEGEKTADAATQRFSDAVVITSPGGSKAAGKADWSPLRDRRVIVWPDADTAGAKYAADVARFTRAARAADVRVIELPAGLPDGWDLADPLPSGWTLDTVRDLLAGARPIGTDKGGARTAGRRAHLVCVADVASEAIEWLWSPRLARGKITLLAGDPGAGKTYLALAITAGLTRGWALPGEAVGREPCGVVYLSREDGVGDTLRPRLDALGADVQRVHVLTGADDGESVSLSDVDVIGDAIESRRAGLVVVDPVQSWLGARVDAHRANETRPVLDALGAVCARHRCACLIIAHTAKARGMRAVTAALGSIDFAGAARVMLIAGADPQEPSRSVLAAAKTNIGPMPGSIAYTVDPISGAFAWAGTVELSAADVLAADTATDDDRSALSEAVNWLRQELASGARPATEMERAAEKARIADHTLRRARRAAKVRSHREGFGPGGVWVWEMPADSIDAHPAPIDGIDAQTPGVGIYDAYATDGRARPAHSDGCGCENCTPPAREVVEL